MGSELSMNILKHTETEHTRPRGLWRVGSNSLTRRWRRPPRPPRGRSQAVPDLHAWGGQGPWHSGATKTPPINNLVLLCLARLLHLRPAPEWLKDLCSLNRSSPEAANSTQDGAHEPGCTHDLENKWPNLLASTCVVDGEGPGPKAWRVNEGQLTVCGGKCHLPDWPNATPQHHPPHMEASHETSCKRRALTSSHHILALADSFGSLRYRITRPDQGGWELPSS